MPVQINALVDASHAQNKITRHSHTGILIYLNKSPIIWYSKSQHTVETSTFGSEFVALKTGIELIRSLWYKLHVMGVPIEGPANVLVDNDSVVKNSTIPSSTLQRKHNSICYHFVRESIAMKQICVTYIPSNENLSDMLTKQLGATKLKTFCHRILYWKSNLIRIAFRGVIEYAHCILRVHCVHIIYYNRHYAMLSITYW